MGRRAERSIEAGGAEGTGEARPRERLFRFGVQALSETELVALVLRTGLRRGGAQALASELLDRVGGLAEMEAASPAQLLGVKGLGDAKAAAVCAAFELGRRAAARPLRRGQPIGHPSDVERRFRPWLAADPREAFHVLLLDGRHRLLAEHAVSKGTLTASLVHPREVFREAIRASAAAVVLVHNHPSGDPTPSAEDRAVTERLRSAGELVGIRVVDHVIVAVGGHFSFREDGALP